MFTVWYKYFYLSKGSKYFYHLWSLIVLVRQWACGGQTVKTPCKAKTPKSTDATLHVVPKPQISRYILRSYSLNRWVQTYCLLSGSKHLFPWLSREAHSTFGETDHKRLRSHTSFYNNLPLNELQWLMKTLPDVGSPPFFNLIWHPCGEKLFSQHVLNKKLKHSDMTTKWSVAPCSFYSASPFIVFDLPFMFVALSCEITGGCQPLQHPLPCFCASLPLWWTTDDTGAFWYMEFFFACVPGDYNAQICVYAVTEKCVKYTYMFFFSHYNRVRDINSFCILF